MSDLKAFIRSTVTENPMLAEIGRFRRKFFSFRGPSVQTNGGLGLIVVLFLMYTMICVYNRGDIEPINQLMIFLVFAFFAIPFMLHASIAGERERRSWDMLLVAPITNAQIVIGKFIGAFLGLVFGFGIFLVPILILAIFYEKTNWVFLLFSVLVVAAQLLTLIAMTILISSRVRRPLMALAVTIGVILIVYAFIPMFAGVAGGSWNSPAVMVFAMLYPFIIIGSLSNIQNFEPTAGAEPPDFLNPYLVTSTFLIVQFLLTAALLAWAIKTLNFADNEVRFINNKKKKSHA